MKNKIYYLTRSYSPYQKGGGPLMRVGAVKYLQELGWDVTVVMPNYGQSDYSIDNNIWRTPFPNSLRWTNRLQRVGYYEDSLDPWVNSTFKYLKEKIKKEDIVFATSGSELGTIKLGSLLQKEIGCKFVVNFRDPLSYSIVDGLKINNKFHVSREHQEAKYLKNADLIITSSQRYRDQLQKKYPKLKSKIHNNYFGYINKTNLLEYQKIKSDKLRIAYVGAMSPSQKPEILYKAYNRLSKDAQAKIQIYYIGNTKGYKPLRNIKNVIFIDYLDHNEFIKFMLENIDIGFVSLANDYLGACVPSKIYEYINLGLPMIGALPDGDGKDIINENQYGVANHYEDIDGLVKTIKRFLDNEFLNNIKFNILNDKKVWAMENKIFELHHLLESL